MKCVLAFAPYSGHPIPADALCFTPRGKSKKTIERERFTALVAALHQIVSDTAATADARVSACAMLLRLREATK